MEVPTVLFTLHRGLSVSRLMIMVVLILMALLTGGCRSSSDTSRQEDQVIPVAILTITPETLRRPVVCSGRVYPLRWEKLAFPLSGRLASMKVNVGEAVQQGSVLASLDKSRLQKSIAAAQIRKTRATRELWRCKRLAQNGKMKNSQVVAARRVATEAETWYDNLKSAAQQADLTAPFHGRVIYRGATPGDSLYPGETVLMVADYEPRARVRVHLSYADYSRINQDDVAFIYAQDWPDLPLSGLVQDHGLSEELTSLPYYADLLFENPAGVASLGSPLTVRIASSSLEKVVLIPQEALIAREGTAGFVFVTDQNDHFAVRRSVQLGPEVGSFIIVDVGLHGGEKLIVRGQKELKEGKRLRIRLESE